MTCNACPLMAPGAEDHTTALQRMSSQPSSLRAPLLLQLNKGTALIEVASRHLRGLDLGSLCHILSGHPHALLVLHAAPPEAVHALAPENAQLLRSLDHGIVQSACMPMTVGPRSTCRARQHGMNSLYAESLPCYVPEQAELGQLAPKGRGVPSLEVVSEAATTYCWYRGGPQTRSHCGPWG